jgi:hypothetical protein
VAVLKHWLLQRVAADRRMILAGPSQFRVFWNPRNLSSASSNATDNLGISGGCAGALFSPGELINWRVRPPIVDNLNIAQWAKICDTYG